jgi:hypothetical protein
MRRAGLLSPQHKTNDEPESWVSLREMSRKLTEEEREEERTEVLYIVIGKLARRGVDTT